MQKPIRFSTVIFCFVVFFFQFLIRLGNQFETANKFRIHDWKFVANTYIAEIWSKQVARPSNGSIALAIHTKLSATAAAAASASHLQQLVFRPLVCIYTCFVCLLDGLPFFSLQNEKQKKSSSCVVSSHHLVWTIYFSQKKRSIQTNHLPCKSTIIFKFFSMISVFYARQNLWSTDVYALCMKRCIALRTGRETEQEKGKENWFDEWQKAYAHARTVDWLLGDRKCERAEGLNQPKNCCGDWAIFLLPLSGARLIVKSVRGSHFNFIMEFCALNFTHAKTQRHFVINIIMMKQYAARAALKMYTS